MREIDITEDCLQFIDNQDIRIFAEILPTPWNNWESKGCKYKIFEKTAIDSFYELRIKAGNEYRIIIFAVNHLNFTECTKAVCLYWFQKKSTKDYKKAIKQAEKILEQYLKEK